MDNEAAVEKLFPDRDVPLQRIHAILDGLAKKEPEAVRKGGTTEDDDAQSGSDDLGKASKKTLRRSAQMQSALSTTASLWTPNTTHGYADLQKKQLQIGVMP